MMKLPLPGASPSLISRRSGGACSVVISWRAWGRRVIKIEHPQGGDLARHLGADQDMAARLQGNLSFLAVNAGKQSVAIDLEDPGPVER